MTNRPLSSYTCILSCVTPGKPQTSIHSSWYRWFKEAPSRFHSRTCLMLTWDQTWKKLPLPFALPCLMKPQVPLIPKSFTSPQLTFLCPLLDHQRFLILAHNLSPSTRVLYPIRVAWWSLVNLCLLLFIAISFVIQCKYPANVQDMPCHPIDRDVISGINTCYLPFHPLGSATNAGWFHPIWMDVGSPSSHTSAGIVLRCLYLYWNIIL